MSSSQLSLESVPVFATSREYTVAQIKRFLELWCSGERMREELETNLEELRHTYGMVPSPREVPFYTDPDYRRQVVAGKIELPAYAKRYIEWNMIKVRWRHLVKNECAPDDPRFRAWRQRQINRSLNDNGPHMEEFLIHTPLAFEFAKGCSVGCWYCGCDAPPLEGLFAFTAENARTWKEILEICLEKIGPATKWGCSYWASDPLDNPDYEQFMDVFHAMTGVYPQTTTAMSDKDLNRTRALLKVSEAKGTKVNRFSIQTMRMLRNVLEYFTAEELVNVEMILQNHESVNVKANAGRFFYRAQEKPNLFHIEKTKLLRQAARDEPGSEKRYVEKDLVLPGTNSCMSGFWVNLVEKSIKLVSPTPGSPRWPRGYILFEETHYTDPKDFAAKLEELMQRHMPMSLPADHPVKFARCFSYRELEQGFALASAHRQLRVENESIAPYLRNLGNMIGAGKNTPGELALLGCFQDQVPESETSMVLEYYFNQGLLMEEPPEAA